MMTCDDAGYESFDDRAGYGSFDDDSGCGPFEDVVDLSDPVSPPPPREDSPIADEVELTPLRVTVQPPRKWFQLKTGLNLFFRVESPHPVDWPKHADVALVFGEDESTLVPSTQIATQALTVIGWKPDGTCETRVGEITNNHMGRPFRIRVTVGDHSVTTSTFEVKTKPTIPKTRKRKPEDPLNMRSRTHQILSRLEWVLSGYYCDHANRVDYNRPFYTCPICKSQQSLGHADTCSIRKLLTIH
jgi:hypothetical protein